MNGKFEVSYRDHNNKKDTFVHVRDLTKYGFFGEVALLNEGGQRTLQVVSENYTETTTIKKQSFLLICDEYPIVQ